MSERIYTSEEKLKTKIIDSLQNSTSFTLVRLGDGESRLVNWDKKKLTQQITWVIKDVIGYNGIIDIPTLQKFYNEFIHSLQNCDGIFIPAISNEKNAYKDLIKILRHKLNTDFKIKDISDLKVFNKFLNENNLKDICKIAKNIFLITSREKSVVYFYEKMGIKIPCKNIFLIPSEGKFRTRYRESLDKMGSQYPDLMYTIKDKISTHIKKGDLVLIGSGPVKLLYLEEIKKVGAVGLDLGSFFDVICGYKTRGLGKKK